MSESDPLFQELMERVRKGCPEAARELTLRYGPHIQRVVRHRLGRHLRSRYDSVDFVQDVWASFFAEPINDRRLDRAEALIAYLVRMARNKVVSAVRGHRRLHPVNQEAQSLETDEVPSLELPADRTTPSQVASANESWQQMMQQLPPHHRRIVLLIQEGRTPGDVARHLGVSERTVFRVLRGVAARPATP